MAESMQMRAMAERAVKEPRGLVYRWNTTLPAALHVFPMLSRCEVVSPDRYRLRLAELSIMRWSIAIVSVVQVRMEAEENIYFHSLPGEGNADVSVHMNLSDTADSGTRIAVDVEVRPRIAIPPLIPVALVERSANATLSLAVQRMLRNIETALRESTPEFHATTAMAQHTSH